MSTTNSTKPTTAEYLATFAPIEPGSAKHQQLIDAYLAKEETHAVYVGMSAFVAALTAPGKIGEMYGHLFGVMPDFPEDVEAPAWSSSHDDPGANSDGQPTRLWLHKVIDDKFFNARICRDDFYDDSADKVHAGEVVMHVNIDRNDFIEFIDPAHVREAAQKLLVAADEYERALAQ